MRLSVLTGTKVRQHILTCLKYSLIKLRLFKFEVLLYKMVTLDNSDIAAACLQMFTKCLLRIKFSHANCIHVAEPRTIREKQ
jgi:hypothetical protein